MKNTVNDPGLGSKFDGSVSRMIGKDGKFNVRRIGEISSIRDTYQFLVRISWWRFNLILLTYFIVLNGLFAGLYVALGIENIKGVPPGDALDDFLNAFYFSVQTFSSVGYGSFSPSGHPTLIVASFEAMFGLVSFALATGLLYGRFSKPKSRLIYSNNAIITPHRDGMALMFRVANHRSTVLMEMSCTVLCTLAERDKDGNFRRKYYGLPLEIDSIHFFPISWTLVHQLDDKSPFYGMNETQIRESMPELMILIKGFDETFSQEIHSRYSYVVNEFKWNHRFLPCFHVEEDGSVSIDLGKVSDIAPIEA